jgi:type IV secretory pathway TraG/TraD family ATPase VirD4
MYICSAGRRQSQFAPLIVAALADVRDATYNRERTGERMHPTLLALDEVANIAPIPDLPAMLSEGAGQGLLVLACLQDLSQARGRWGSAAEGFLTLFGTTVVFPGIADVTTLRDLSALAGEHEVASTTLGHSLGSHGHIRPSSSVGTVRVARLPVDVISRGSPGRALIVSPARDFGSVRLTPAHASSPWRELTAAARTQDRAPAGRGR